MNSEARELEGKRRRLIKTYTSFNPSMLDEDDVWLLTKPLKGFPKTWSYEIMGNKDADWLFYAYGSFILSHFTDSQWEAYMKEKKANPKKDIELMHKHRRKVLSQCYNDLLRFVESKRSRLAYQVLGVFLMNMGASISEDLKQTILENARWEDVPYLKREQDQEERKKALSIFRKALNNYEGKLPPEIKLNPERGYLRQPIYHLKYKRENHAIIKQKRIDEIKEQDARLNAPSPDFGTFIQEISKLLDASISGRSHVKQGAMENNGYLFIFKDYSEVPDELNLAYSHKVCTVGTMRHFEKDLENLKKYDFNSLMAEEKEDLLLMASLKTLLPELKFGGDEVMFDSFMLVKTPEGKVFPATFYYGPSGLSMGGWSGFSDHFQDAGKFPKEFSDLINGSPHELTDEQLEPILEALVLGLRNVPPSDFQGKIKTDYGKFLMGVKRGASFIDLI